VLLLKEKMQVLHFTGTFTLLHSMFRRLLIDSHILNKITADVNFRLTGGEMQQIALPRN
jgi:hypothetical protein